jgi:hypothetical protein
MNEDIWLESKKVIKRKITTPKRLQYIFLLFVQYFNSSYKFLLYRQGKRCNFVFRGWAWQSLDDIHSLRFLINLLI